MIPLPLLGKREAEYNKPQPGCNNYFSHFEKALVDLLKGNIVARVAANLPESMHLIVIG